MKSDKTSGHPNYSTQPRAIHCWNWVAIGIGIEWGDGPRSFVRRHRLEVGEGDNPDAAVHAEGEQVGVPCDDNVTCVVGEQLVRHPMPGQRSAERRADRARIGSLHHAGTHAESRMVVDPGEQTYRSTLSSSPALSPRVSP